MRGVSGARRERIVRSLRVAAAAATLAVGLPAVAAAAEPTATTAAPAATGASGPSGPTAGAAAALPFRTNDAGGVRNILPPGQNGFVTAPGIAAFLSAGTRPAHNDDQLRMYGDLSAPCPACARVRWPATSRTAASACVPGTSSGPTRRAPT